jgi:hypothetical protein
MSRKGIPRSQQHEWEPQEEEKVLCSKCKILVSVADARRGVGVCEGPSEEEPETRELSPEDIRDRLPSRKPFAPSGQDHGKCNGCGEDLRELPFNSRLAMVACNQRSCGLYRQRLRWVTIK